MRTRLTLHPEQRGAQQLRAQYGEQLVCVRYRYDEERQRRLKTVELIVEEKPWTPPGPRRTEQQAVAVRVAAPEVALRTQVKRAGGHSGIPSGRSGSCPTSAWWRWGWQGGSWWRGRGVRGNSGQASTARSCQASTGRERHLCVEASIC